MKKNGHDWHPDMELSWFEKCKPSMAMIAIQFFFTFGTFLVKSLFSNGTSPMVFVCYRQVVATLVMVPITLVVEGPRQMALGLRAFLLVFATTLSGCTLNQYLYYQGLKMTSATMSTAMDNLIPAATFLMAASCGLEVVKLKSLRSMAKVLGTIISVGGAICLTLYKGPNLLGLHQPSSPILHSVNEHWMTGSVLLIASNCCGALWIILQVPICKKYLDPLSLASWMCIFSTLQSVALTYFLESNLKAWRITSISEFVCIIYTGIFSSGVTFYLQSWVISVRGPVFSALFNPLQVIIATTFTFLLLHEELYTGSLIGAATAVGGLYMVLWGKAKDLDADIKHDQEGFPPTLTTFRGEQRKHCEADITGPLLSKRLNDIESPITS